jgi:'Cold-shock' DNA-binding domain
MTVWRDPAVFFDWVPSAEGRKNSYDFKQLQVIIFSCTVKWFNEAKGFGFIRRDDGSELFVPYTNIVGSGFRTL